MYLNNWKTRAHLQWTFHIAACTLLLFSIAMLAGCGGGGTQTDNTGRKDSNSNTPAPSPSIAPKTLTLGDTPIDVSGGSIHLQMGIPAQNGTGSYDCQSCNLGALAVYDDDAPSAPTKPETALSTTPFDQTQHSYVITIKLQQQHQDLVITGNRGTNKVSVTFSEDDPQNPNANNHDFRFRTRSLGFTKRGNNRIDEVKFSVDGGNATPVNLPQNKKVSIEITFK